MKPRTKSILQELSEISRDYDKNQQIENQALNVIASVTNLIEKIHDTYPDEVSIDLEKRLLNSIRTKDEKKFLRGIRKAGKT